MTTIFEAFITVLTQKPIIMLLACPIPFYGFGLVWGAFHFGGDDI